MGFRRTSSSVLAASFLSLAPLANGQTCLPPEEQTILDFRGSNLSENTLEMDDAGLMRFNEIGSHRQGDATTLIDLVIQRIPGEDYDFHNLDYNKKNGSYGSINVKAPNGQGSFDFCFEESATGNPVTLDHFYVSFFYDNASSRNDVQGFEQVTLRKSDFIEYYLTDTTEIVTEETNSRVTFTATHQPGHLDDNNPEDPNDSTPVPKDRGVVLLMRSLGCFEVKLSVGCGDQDDRGNNSSRESGRNFFFAGRVDQLVPPCPTLQRRLRFQESFQSS